MKSIALITWLVGLVRAQYTLQRNSYYNVTVHSPQVICTCDKLAIEEPGEPGILPVPDECMIQPRIVFYLLWIEDDLGLGHLHEIPSKDIHIMNMIYSNFLDELYKSVGDEYEIEIRNIRKGHTPHNAYTVWKTFKLTGASSQLLQDNQSRAGAPYFYNAFNVLNSDLNSIDDKVDPLVFAVTLQGRLKVLVKNNRQDCSTSNFIDSAMLVLDKKWTQTSGRRLTYNTKQDIVSGMSCALKEKPAISENFNYDGRCLTATSTVNVYRECPIYLQKRTYRDQVEDLVEVFAQKIRSQVQDPCPTTRVKQVGIPESTLPYRQTQTIGTSAQLYPDQVCYVDLIIALDLGCMNRAEYAGGKPQQLVNALTRQIINRDLIKPDHEFRVSLIGFNEKILITVPLSTFTFDSDRNPAAVQATLRRGLESLERMLSQGGPFSYTDFTRSFRQIGKMFDSRSHKRRQVVIVTDGQNGNNYEHGNGQWTKSEKARLDETLTLRFNSYPNTHIVALAVNPPCTFQSGTYPEDCSFVEVLQKLDPTFVSNERTLQKMRNDQVERFATKLINDIEQDIVDTAKCFPSVPSEPQDCSCAARVEVCVSDTDDCIEGPKGPPGPRGERGPPGPTGLPGSCGLPGMTGQQGRKGATGRQGIKGLPAPPAPNGRRGLPGDDGEDGRAGIKGRSGRPSDVVGKRGSVGHPGQPGSRGESGLPGRKGVKGITGPVGNSGPVGRSGQKGQKGQDMVKNGRIIEDEYQLQLDINRRLTATFDSSYDQNPVLETISTIASRFVGVGKDGKSFCECQSCTSEDCGVTPTRPTTTTRRTTTRWTTARRTTPTTTTAQPPQPRCDCEQKRKMKDLTIFFDNSESVTSLPLEVYEAMIDSIGMIADKWADEPDIDLDSNSILIVGKFSSRIKSCF